MCIVSMTFDHYGQGGGTNPYQWMPFKIPQTSPNVSPDLPWTRELLDEFKKIVQKIEDLDKKLGLPDCHDPKKADWMKAIEERLGKLEKKKK